MYHTIQFSRDLQADAEISPRDRLERVRIRKGTRLKAQIKPYVVEGPNGPMEVADLFFQDGSTIRGISFDCFSFVEDANPVF
jgi:hypothetical protein